MLLHPPLVLPSPSGRSVDCTQGQYTSMPNQRPPLRDNYLGHLKRGNSFLLSFNTRGDGFFLATATVPLSSSPWQPNVAVLPLFLNLNVIMQRLPSPWTTAIRRNPQLIWRNFPSLSSNSLSGAELSSSSSSHVSVTGK